MAFDTSQALSIQTARTIDVGRGNGGSTPGTPGGATPTIVWDGFESGDMSAPNGPAPYLNNTGFTWDGTGNITDHLFPAKTGNNCIEFTYPGAGGNPQQYFTIGAIIFPEIWLSFWIRVPDNFYHGGADPSNNKIFRLWQDIYDGGFEKFGMEFRRSSSGPGNADFYLWPGSGSTDSVPFVNRATDLGKWQHLVIRARIESSPGASDGLMQVWRKWEDEANHTKTHERLNINIPRSTAPGREGWRLGYLMGWANSGYDADTTWLIDDFKMSETSLLEE